MRTPLPDPRPGLTACPTAPRPRAHPPAGRHAAHPPGWLAAALALAPLLLANCTDDVAANCPPLAHPEVLTVAAAAGNPCAARRGRSGALLQLGVVPAAAAGGLR